MRLVNSSYAHERVPLSWDALVGIFYCIKSATTFTDLSDKVDVSNRILILKIGGVMKEKLIVCAIVLVVIVGLLAYYQYVPFWVSIVSTGSFLFGVFLGWLAKGWSDKHVS